MTQYLIMGSGRWARHLERTLVLAGHHPWRWSRSQPESELVQKLPKVTHLWLAISDQALASVADRWRHQVRYVLHSSGALEIAGAHSVHPLMSFAPELYPDDFYSKFAFVSTSAESREVLIPGLKNPFARLRPEQKALYHALCVLAGNGSVLLWQKFFAEMKDFGVPTAAAQLYAARINQNLQTNPATALTGPLVRGDHPTLAADEAALAGDAFQKVFAALVSAYQLDPLFHSAGGAREHS